MKEQVKETVNTAKQIIQEEFDLTLETNSLKIYSLQDWQELEEKINIKEKDGFFVPNSMTARLKDDENVLHTLIHEHLAHRTYFEHSQDGLKLRKLETDLSELEKLIIGKQYHKLDSEAIIKFVIDYDNIQPKINEEENILTVNYNPHFPLANSHLQLSQQIINYKNQLEPYAEAFAEWLTKYLTKKMDINNVKIGGKTDIRTYKVYQQFLNIETQTGPLTALYAAKIKRSHQPKQLQQLLKETFKDKLELAEIIIKYGSNKPFSDLDLLLVVPKEKEEMFKQIIVPNYLDVSFVNKEKLVNQLNLSDIQYTTPLFDGFFLKGEERKEELLSFARSIPEKEDYIRMLHQQHRKAKELAIKCFQVYQIEKSRQNKFTQNMKNNIARTLVNLTYATTYQHLIKLGNPNQRHDKTLFNQIKENNLLLNETRKYLKSLYENFNNFNENKVQHLLTK